MSNLFNRIIFTLLLASQAHAKNINVMIVDTGIDLDNPKLMKYVYSKQPDVDTHGHGTHVAGLILYGKDLKDPVCSEVKVHVCRFYGGYTNKTTSQCFEDANRLKVDVVNFSGGGVKPSELEEIAIRSSKALFIVSAGNERSDLSKPGNDYYPAEINASNLIAVASGKSNLEADKFSNYGLARFHYRDGKEVTSFGIRGNEFQVMTGTSQAAALFTHDHLKFLCHRLRSAK
jgi:subtilisin family serine protease